MASSEGRFFFAEGHQPAGIVPVSTLRIIKRLVLAMDQLVALLLIGSIFAETVSLLICVSRQRN